MEDPHLSIFAINVTKTLIYVAIMIVFLIISAFCSMSETVFSSASKAKLMTYVEENKKGARKALWLTENYDLVLTVILVGNNLVNIAISTLGLRLFLGLFNSTASWVDVVNTAVITLVVLIFGEILPKSKGKANSELKALKLSSTLYAIVKIFKPLVYVFYKMNKHVNKNVDVDESLSSDDLENIIDVMEDNGDIEENEAEMLQKVLDLGEIEIKNILTPRVDVSAIEINTPIEEIKRCFIDNQYSRVPVYEGSIDHIVGILFEKEFFKALITNPTLKNIKPLLQKPLFVVGSMTADKLLSLLKTKNVHLAIVLDEYGGFDGIVTMEDVLEELVGEIFDEHDEVPETIKKISKNKYIVSGDLEVQNLFDYFNFKEEWDEDSPTTIGGLIQDKLERLPLVNDEVSLEVVSEVDFDELDNNEGILKKTLLFKVKEIQNNRIKSLELIIE